MIKRALKDRICCLPNWRCVEVSVTARFGRALRCLAALPLGDALELFTGAGGTARCLAPALAARGAHLLTLEADAQQVTGRALALAAGCTIVAVPVSAPFPPPGDP